MIIKKLEKDIKKMHNIKKIVVAGDSWTYGSEIRDPTLPKRVNDWDEPNDKYRLPRIWPNKLGKMIGIDDVVNLSYPAGSNDRTVRHLMGWLTEYYLKDNKPTDELFVVIGLTSPERKDFYYRSKRDNWWFTLWPMWEHKYPQDDITNFSKLYIKNFYHSEEYTHRYINQIFYLQTVFKQYNIKYLFFQAFYQYKDLNIRNWLDSPHYRHYNSQPDRYIWDMIDPIRFMHKQDEIQSFHNYIINKDKTEYKTDSILNMHPTELGHTWWAEHIYEYCKENDLW